VRTDELRATRDKFRVDGGGNAHTSGFAYI
jgi:hypothetical protein